MRFTVVWNPLALDQLAAVWTIADDRQAVSDAADEIDANPREFGDRLGGDFSNDDYIHPHGPIAVTFTRNFDDRLIRVTRVLKARQDTL